MSLCMTVTAQWLLRSLCLIPIFSFYHYPGLPPGDGLRVFPELTEGNSAGEEEAKLRPALRPITHRTVPGAPQGHGEGQDTRGHLSRPQQRQGCMAVRLGGRSPELTCLSFSQHKPLSAFIGFQLEMCAPRGADGEPSSFDRLGTCSEKLQSSVRPLLSASPALQAPLSFN